MNVILGWIAILGLFMWPTVFILLGIIDRDIAYMFGGIAGVIAFFTRNAFKINKFLAIGLLVAIVALGIAGFAQSFPADRRTAYGMIGLISLNLASSFFWRSWIK